MDMADIIGMDAGKDRAKIFGHNFVTKSVHGFDHRTGVGHAAEPSGRKRKEQISPGADAATLVS